ncbi:hypothetical protein SFMTTN_1785 [Sulfuriferula multivorans]|uniref:Uncharacterized protein n=1 Tax=Sulfuriferula multivorans TaxID=1559896 RepID=A0A401JED0_9PROT|nr:hypothetical protein SFMTTN_1785 [Sulfuriferula multivorans]
MFGNNPSQLEAQHPLLQAAKRVPAISAIRQPTGLVQYCRRG